MAKILIIGSVASSLINFRGPLLQEMVALGHEINACAPEAPADIRTQLSNIGVTYHEIRIERTSLSPLQAIYSILNLITLFKKIKPDVYLGYTIKPVIYGSIAARVTRVSNIYSIISGLGYTFSNSGIKAKIIGLLVKSLYKIALHFNQKVFFQNPDDLTVFNRHGLLRRFDQAVLINGSGVDLNLFTPKQFPTHISFLLISRLIKEKGIYEYVETAQKIKEKYPKIKFSLVGYIDEKYPSAISREDLNKWIESGIIDFQGFLKDVRPAIENCTVYVLPSFYPEGTPRSVLEAMAMGRPIITTDSPGCRETVQHGVNGFLVPKYDVPALVEAAEFYIQNPAEISRTGLASRRIAEEKYDVHKVNAVILKAMELS